MKSTDILVTRVKKFTRKKFPFILSALFFWLKTYLKRSICIIYSEGSCMNFSGGIVMQPFRLGKSGHRNNLIHEIGHILGLWHVHHGISEVDCDDPCREDEPSLLTGNCFDF